MKKKKSLSDDTFRVEYSGARKVIKTAYGTFPVNTICAAKYNPGSPHESESNGYLFYFSDPEDPEKDWGIKICTCCSSLYAVPGLSFKK